MRHSLHSRVFPIQRLPREWRGSGTAKRLSWGPRVATPGSRQSSPCIRACQPHTLVQGNYRFTNWGHGGSDHGAISSPQWYLKGWYICVTFPPIEIKVVTCLKLFLKHALLVVWLVLDQLGWVEWKVLIVGWSRGEEGSAELGSGLGQRPHCREPASRWPVICKPVLGYLWVTFRHIHQGLLRCHAQSPLGVCSFTYSTSIYSASAMCPILFQMLGKQQWGGKNLWVTQTINQPAN